MHESSIGPAEAAAALASLPPPGNYATIQSSGARLSAGAASASPAPAPYAQLPAPRRRLAVAGAALMATEAVCKLWFPAAARGTRPAAPALRVLCFHNAGSAESTYTQPYIARGKREPNELQAWAAAHNAEVLAVQLPGREARRGEPALRSCQAVAAALLPIVEPLVRDTRYVVVAHSVGTWNSYELLCLLRERGIPMPVRIFYSGFASPDIPEAERPWTAQAQLPTDVAFQQECRGWDVNEVVFSAGMWGVYKDLMRADFCCFDEYRYTHASEPPLAVPMTTFYAATDKKITQAMVQGWSKHAAADGSFECLPIPLRQRAQEGVVWAYRPAAGRLPHGSHPHPCRSSSARGSGGCRHGGGRPQPLRP